MNKTKVKMFPNIKFMVGLAITHVKSVLVLIVLGAFFYVGNEMLSLAMIPWLLQQIQNQSNIKNMIIGIVAFSFGIMLLNGLHSYIETNNLFGRIELRRKIIGMISEKVMGTSFCNLDCKEFQDMKNKVLEYTSSNHEAAERIWTTLETILQYVLGLGFFVLMLGNLHGLIVLVTILTTVIGYYFTLKSNEWKYLNKEKEQAFTSKLAYIQNISMKRTLAKDIRLFGMQAWLNEIYQKSMQSYMSFQLQGQKRYFFANVIDLILSVVRNGIAYAWLIHLVMNNQMSVVEFVFYFSVISRLSIWLIAVLSEFSTLHKQTLDIQVIRDFLQYQEPFDFDSLVAIPVQEENTIELRNVSFRYPNGDKDILRHVNLVFRPKEKLAIVGLNGAGKTTLIKLLMGFYDPTEGEVLFNGINIKTFHRAKYYELFSAVFQQHSILATTIAKNVAQNTQGYEEEKVINCLRLAGLESKVNSLPNGMHTRLCRDVYEDATELSGGQVQKLLLARAIYKDVPFLILDEPTAALDPIAEHEMYVKYNELTAQKSSVFISHRLVSTQFCNRILLIGNGGIVEEGSHEELLSIDGAYAQLFRVQSEYYQEDVIYDECIS